MDPLGLALENYDAIGQWRDYDGPYLIDPSGVFPSGEAFTTPHEMAQIVRDDPATAVCVARHLFTYLMGRGLETNDTQILNELDRIETAWARNGHILEELLVQIVKSPSFTHRMPPDAPTGESE